MNLLGSLFNNVEHLHTHKKLFFGGSRSFIILHHQTKLCTTVLGDIVDMYGQGLRGVLISYHKMVILADFHLPPSVGEFSCQAVYELVYLHAQGV